MERHPARRRIQRGLYSFLEPPDQPPTHRVAKRCVCHDAAIKEARRADPLGPVDDLRGEAKVAGADLLAEGADGAEGEDGADAEVFEGGDVGAGGDGGGGEGVVLAVAGDEGDAGARGEGAEGDG